MSDTLAPLHILRTGTWTDMHGQAVTITAADLATIAQNYDPVLHRAPLVVGHPKHNSPAFGWFASLRAEGDDLFGTPEQVDPAFAAAVREGRYPERSASLYRPAHPDNPVPGGWYLRHVGALGGTPPAVKGLRGADLGASPDGLVTIDFSLPVAMAADPVSIEDLPMPDPTAADLAARAAELEAQAAAVKVQEQQLKVREAELCAQAKSLEAKAKAQEAQQMNAFCEGLADEARIRPADVPALAAMLLTLPADPAADFAAPDDTAKTPTPPATWFKGWLSTLPPLVELGETATKARAAGTQTPDETAIVSRAQALHAEALRVGAPISFAAACERAAKETK